MNSRLNLAAIHIKDKILISLVVGMIAQLDKEYLKTNIKNIVQRLVSYFVFEGRPLTTHGRFINSFVFFLLNFIKNIECKSNKNLSVISPIFIIGIGRSGTTVLGKILSTHKDVGYLNEPKAIWHSVFPFEDINGNYTTGNARIELTKNDLTDSSKKELTAIYCHYLKIIGASRVVDKYPALVYRIPFILSVFPDAKFIFLVRNGYDNLLSIKRWSERKGRETSTVREDWWGLNNRKWKLILKQIIREKNEWNDIKDHVEGFQNHLDKATVEWIISMRAGLEAEKNFKSSIMRIHYEDLVANPELVLREIREFTQLKESETMLNYAKKVLGDVPEKDRPNLDCKIQSLFDETMQELGYNS